MSSLANLIVITCIIIVHSYFVTKNKNYLNKISQNNITVLYYFIQKAK